MVLTNDDQMNDFVNSVVRGSPTGATVAHPRALEVPLEMSTSSASVHKSSGKTPSKSPNSDSKMSIPDSQLFSPTLKRGSPIGVAPTRTTEKIDITPRFTPKRTSPVRQSDVGSGDEGRHPKTDGDALRHPKTGATVEEAVARAVHVNPSPPTSPLNSPHVKRASPSHSPTSSTTRTTATQSPSLSRMSSASPAHVSARSSPVAARASPVAARTSPTRVSTTATRTSHTSPTRKTFIDMRSPQISPVATSVSPLHYQDIIQTPVVTRAEDVYSARIRTTPRVSPNTIIVEVMDNGDGTYSPIHKQSPYRGSTRYTPKSGSAYTSNSTSTYTPNSTSSEAISENPYETPPPRSNYAHLTEDQKYKLRFDFEAAINRLVDQNPQLDLAGVDENSNMSLDELKGYLDHIREQVGKEEQWKWLDMGINGLYNIIALIMEKYLNIPMGDYFEKLRNRIVDYRQLLMQDETVSELVEAAMPMTSATSGRRSTWIIITVMVAQVVIGCVAAAIAKWGSGALSAGSGIGAAMASSQLDSYIFEGKSLLSSVVQIFKSVTSTEPPARPAGVRV